MGEGVKNFLGRLKRRLEPLGFEIRHEERRSSNDYSMPWDRRRVDHVFTFTLRLTDGKAVGNQKILNYMDLAVSRGESSYFDYLARHWSELVASQAMNFLDPDLPTAETPDWRPSSMVPEDFYAK